MLRTLLRTAWATKLLRVTAAFALVATTLLLSVLTPATGPLSPASAEAGNKVLATGSGSGGSGDPALAVSKAGNGNGTVTSNPAGINCGATCSASFTAGTAVTLTAVADPTSTFAGWSGACSGLGNCILTMNAPLSATANFVRNTFSLTVSRAGTGGGTVTSTPTGIACGATCSASFDAGTLVTLTATPDATSSFAGWSGGGCSGTGICVVSMSQSRNVTATFTFQPPIQTPTTTTLSPSLNPSTQGQEVTFTATVANVGSGSAVTGSVDFKDNGATVFNGPLAGGVATWLTAGLTVGTHPITAVYAGDPQHSGSASNTVNQVVSAEAAPPFSQTFPTPATACICTPPVMNTDIAGTETWFVQAAGGDLKIRVIAHAVNMVDPERVDVAVKDGGGAVVGTTTVSYTAADVASALGFEKAAPLITVAAAAVGAIYRVEVTTPPPTPGTQPHYRLVLEGANSAGVNSPTFKSLEDVSPVEPLRWIINVNGGEGIQLDTFTTGVPTPAFNFSYRITGPGGVLVQDSGGLVPLVGINVAGPLPAGAYVLHLREVDGHYRLNKVSGSDRGIYADWITWGHGIKTVNAYLDGLPLAAGAATASLYRETAPGSGQYETTAYRSQPTGAGGATQFTNLPVGRYRVDLSPLMNGLVPAPNIFGPGAQFDEILCDQEKINRFDYYTLPGIAVNDVSVLEGNSGATNANFTVTLSRSVPFVVTVNFATHDATAIAGSDYTTTTGMLTFAPGETIKLVPVPVLGDLIPEPNETFTLDLSGATNATITDNQGIGAIINDDACPTITLSPTSLPNGRVGVAYSQTLTASGGRSPYVFGVSNASVMPPGLGLRISGILTGWPSTTDPPTTAGVYTFEAMAQDSDFCSGSQVYTITIDPPTATISNFVWQDINGNGIQDPGEPGMPGVGVELRDGTGATVVASTVTVAGGLYSFTATAGSYTLKFIPLPGWGFTLQDQGGDDTKDSDANQTTGLTAAFAVAAGATDDTRDAGLVQADVVITKTGPSTATTGDQGTYILSVRNNGPTAAANVVVTDVLPAGVSFVSAGQGCSNSNGTVTCNLGMVSTGSNETTTTVTVTFDTPGIKTNTGTVTSTTPDAIGGNNSSSTSTDTAQRTYALTVSRAGNGSGTVTSSPVAIFCGAACSASFDAGTAVTLTATPDANSSFAGWSGACVGAGSCVLTMDAAKAVTATFTKNTYPLTVTKAGSATGTVTSSPAGIDCGATCSASFDAATLVTLTATADTGSSFAGWSGACAGAASCLLSMDAAKAVTATFTLQGPLSNLLLGNFVAFSVDQTWIKKGAKVFTGSVGANQAQPEPPRRTHLADARDDDRDRDGDDNDGRRAQDRRVEVKIGENVQVLGAGSVVAGDTVWLRKGSSIVNLGFNEVIKGKNTHITGSQTTPVTLPLFTLPALPSFNAGTTNVTVARNQTRTLAAGSYGAITVERGATLVLSGGVYNVGTVDIRENAKVQVQAATELRVKNEFDTDKGAYFGPAPGATITAKNIKVLVAGSDDRSHRRDGNDDDVDDGEASPTAVQVGENNTFKANIYAPNGTVWLKKGIDGTGAFIGKRLQVGENAKLTLDSAFAP